MGALIALAAAGCERDEGERVCPSVAAGELVVTEISGVAADQWIEIYNATGEAIDLAGIRLRLRRLDGSGEQVALVRSYDVMVAAGGYVTLGRFERGAEPAHVDYGLDRDVATALYDSGAIEVASCETVVDTAVYRNLPSTGSWSLGTMPPSAVANDDPASWCLDEGDAAEPGIHGTPQEENRPCP